MRILRLNYEKLLMMKITPKRIIALPVIAILLFALPFWISGFLSYNRLSHSFNPAFNITTVVDLSEKDILSEAEISNDGSFIEYICLYKDSCLKLIKAGTIAKSYSSNISDMITITKRVIPSPNTYITGMTYSIPCFVEAATIRSFYNVYLLPMNDLSRIKMYISGEIKAIEHKSPYEVKYKLLTNNVSLAFNKEKETNLRYAIGADGSLTDADFTFKIDPKTNNFYVIVAAKSWNTIKQ